MSDLHSSALHVSCATETPCGQITERPVVKWIKSFRYICTKIKGISQIKKWILVLLLLYECWWYFRAARFPECKAQQWWLHRGLWGGGLWVMLGDSYSTGVCVCRQVTSNITLSLIVTFVWGRLSLRNLGFESSPHHRLFSFAFARY